MTANANPCLFVMLCSFGFGGWALTGLPSGPCVQDARRPRCRGPPAVTKSQRHDRKAGSRRCPRDRTSAGRRWLPRSLDPSDSGHDQPPHRDTPFSILFLRSAWYVALMMRLGWVIARCPLLSPTSYQRQRRGEPVAGASAERPILVVHRWFIRVSEAGNRPFATDGGVCPVPGPAADAGA